MKKIVSLIIAICLLNVGNPVPSFAADKHKKHHKHFQLFKHKKRERLKKWNSGHTEFKDRPKKEQKKLRRHHIKP